MSDDGITVQQILDYCESQRHSPDAVLSQCCCGTCRVANLIRCAQKEAARKRSIAQEKPSDPASRSLRSAVLRLSHMPWCVVSPCSCAIGPLKELAEAMERPDNREETCRTDAPADGGPTGCPTAHVNPESTTSKESASTARVVRLVPTLASVKEDLEAIRADCLGPDNMAVRVAWSLAMQAVGLAESASAAIDDDVRATAAEVLRLEERAERLGRTFERDRGHDAEANALDAEAAARRFFRTAAAVLARALLGVSGEAGAGSPATKDVVSVLLAQADAVADPAVPMDGLAGGGRLIRRLADTLRAVALEKQAERSPASPWRPVTEAEPVTSPRTVLVLMDGFEPAYEAYIRGDQWVTMHGLWERKPGDLWMPMPVAPRKDGP